MIRYILVDHYKIKLCIRGQENIAGLGMIKWRNKLGLSCAKLKLATNQLGFSYSLAGDAYSASCGWSWKFLIFS